MSSELPDIEKQRDAIPYDLAEMANRLGFDWPDDEPGRWRCLKSMAKMAEYWRSQAERRDPHQQRRVRALNRKVRNLRRALRQFMAARVAYVCEALAEIEDGRR